MKCHHCHFTEFPCDPRCFLLGSLPKLLLLISPLFWLQFVFHNCYKTIRIQRRNCKISLRPSNMASEYNQ
jgi:hypothetical protein